MTTAPSIDLVDYEQLWHAVKNVTLDPIKNTVYDFLPFLSAMSSYYMPLKPGDYSQKGMIPPGAAATIFQEVDRLRNCADLSRDISLYSALNFHFISYGGSLSLTKPVLVIPYQHLFRPDGSHFGNEKPDEKLASNIHAFTDDETRFFIAREIGHIKFNNAFLKTAAKILLIAAICFLYTTPLGWPVITSVAIGAMALYLLIDRYYEGKIDLFAAKIVGDSIGDHKRAAQAALSALGKLREQNLERRSANLLTRVYMDKDGNNILALKHPLLTNRIAQMQKLVESFA